MSLLDTIIANQSGMPEIVSENHGYFDGCHQLDNTTGRVSMFAAGELPWHKLGVLVREAVTSEHAARLSGTGWIVDKVPLMYDFNGMSKMVKDRFGIVRRDTGACLGTVGKQYQPIQNGEAFDFLDGVLEEFGARYESAGSLFGGEKVWMLARMPKQSFTINGGDNQEAYVAFMNYHERSRRVQQYFPRRLYGQAKGTVHPPHGQREG